MRGYQVTWMPGLRRGGAGPGAWGTLDSCFNLSSNLRSKRFGLGAKNEERESKTARKMAQVKERGGGGGVGKKGRKQTSLRASSPIWACEASLSRTRHARAELLLQLFCSLRACLHGGGTPV